MILDKCSSSLVIYLLSVFFINLHVDATNEKLHVVVKIFDHESLPKYLMHIITCIKDFLLYIIICDVFNPV